jgi:predicted metalloprotease with PDZ domain
VGRATGFVLLLAAIAGSVGSAHATPRDPPAVIDYRVTRIPPGADGNAAFEITLRFKGGRDGRSDVYVPSEWASAQHAERGIDALRVATPGARLADVSADDSTPTEGQMLRRRITHRPGAMLEVHYRLRQIADGEPSAKASTNYLPVIRPGYFEWIGWTSWVVPVVDERKVRVRVHFDGLPDDWNFASTFGLDRANVSFEGPIDTFRQSIFVGGDFRLRSRPVRGGQVVVAVRGEWPFRDSELADRLQTIIDGERAFWADEDRHDFLVTMMPLAAEPGVQSVNGTGLGQSFATFLTPARSLDDLDGLFTHEYFHTWNATGLGEFREPEALGYWFSEGFTDYYTHLLRLRWGMLTLEGYAALYDDIYRALAALPEAELPNAEIGPRFFSEGRTVGKLPYQRGMLLAAKWDAEIRAASDGRRSLDDVMHRLRREYLHGAKHLDAARIVAAAQAFGARDPKGDVERYIDAGARLALTDGTLTRCVRIDTITEPTFDAGFDTTATTRTRTLTHVDPAGPAYAAGIRDGEHLFSGSIRFGNKDLPIRLVVASDAAAPPRTVEYLPVGRVVTRPHVAPTAGITNEDADRCLREFGARQEGGRSPPPRS